MPNPTPSPSEKDREEAEKIFNSANEEAKRIFKGADGMCDAMHSETKIYVSLADQATTMWIEKIALAISTARAEATKAAHREHHAQEHVGNIKCEGCEAIRRGAG